MKLGGREEFIEEMLPSSFSEESLQEGRTVITNILECLSLPERCKILNVSSIGGYYSSILAEKKFTVTACELSETIIKACKEKCQTSGLSVCWVGNTLATFQQRETFDLILSLGYSFGIFQGTDEDQKTIKNFYHSLNLGGKLVIQLVGRDMIEKYFHPKYWKEEDQGCYLLSERKMDYQSGVVQENYTVIKKEQVKKFQYNVKLYYPLEICSLLEKQGFTEVKIYGDTDGRPYDDRANCLIVIGEKMAHTTSNFIKC